MKVRAGNISLEVEEQGTGEPALVFLHYWGGSRRTWTKVMDGLKNNYRCVAYDQRGWGGSDAPAEGYALADLAEDALSLIAAMGLRRYVLVGHSMGGKVAQLVASRRGAGGRVGPVGFGGTAPQGSSAQNSWFTPGSDCRERTSVAD
jgi:3-oxoadipate enol-lactonase